MSTPKLNINELFQTDAYCNPLYLPFSKQVIQMREMITADQKFFLKHVAKLQDKEFVQRKIGVLFNDLLEKLIKDVDFTKMPLQDKLFIMLFLRGKMKGDKTQLSVKCPKCNADITFGYDLGRFQDRIKKMADEIKLPFEVPVGDMIYVVNSVMISDEIETDKMLSNPDFVKLYGMDEAHLSNMLRVASAIKRIISPKGELEMSEHTMQDRISLFMRTPVTVVSDISKVINDMTSKMADMMTDKFQVPCLQPSCEGKTEVVVAIGDEGFFIPKSLESPAVEK